MKPNRAGTGILPPPRGVSAVNALLALVRALSARPQQDDTADGNDRRDDQRNHDPGRATAAAAITGGADERQVRVGRRGVREQDRPDLRGLAEPPFEAIRAVRLEVTLVGDDVVRRGVVEGA